MSRVRIRIPEGRIRIKTSRFRNTDSVIFSNRHHVLIRRNDWYRLYRYRTYFALIYCDLLIFLFHSLVLLICINFGRKFDFIKHLDGFERIRIRAKKLRIRNTLSLFCDRT